MTASEYWERPCGAAGLNSYRYRGRFRFVMIGASTHADALREAQRSLSNENAIIANLEAWDGEKYITVTRVLRQCPNCGYMVNGVQVNAARFDYRCPRCGGAKIGEFIKFQGAT